MKIIFFVTVFFLNFGFNKIQFLNENGQPLYRGIYENPFKLFVNNTKGACVVVSTNGVLPIKPSNLPERISPFEMSISSTTILLAAPCDAVDQRNVSARSYIFLSSIVSGQPNQPVGFPTQWGGGGGRAADYQFLPSSDPAVAGLYKQGLAALPIVSLIIDKTDFADPNTGAYRSSSPGGLEWERTASIELIKPGGTPTAESSSDRCGVRAQGGSSARNWKSPKMSMRVLFRSEYGGNGQLSLPAWFYDRYRTMPVDGSPDHPRLNKVIQASDKVNTLVLDAGLNYQWNHPTHDQHEGHVMYRDQLVSDLLLKMGRLQVHGQFVHLFVSGLYWGIHGVHERPDDAFLDSYVGPERPSFNVIRHASTNVLQGTAAEWTSAQASVNSLTFSQLSTYIDMPSLVDYMLMNFYVGNEDWDFHNWYAASHNKSVIDGLRAAKPQQQQGRGNFFLSTHADFHRLYGGPNEQPVLLWTPISWDAEKSLRSGTTNILDTNNENAPSGLHAKLLAKALSEDESDSDYLVLWRDAVYRHLIDENGALFSNGNCNEAGKVNRPCDLFRSVVTDSFRSALALDSGRWGDSQHAGQVDGVVNVFDNALQTIESSFFNVRHGQFLSQLQQAKLAPRVHVPTLQDSGNNIIRVTHVNPCYCTVDGTDPRARFKVNANDNQLIMVGNGGQLTVSAGRVAVVQCREKQGNEWSPVSRLLHFPDYGSPDWHSKLVVSEISYHPDRFSDAEWIELYNMNEFDVDVSLSECVDGIECFFPLGTLVKARSFFVIAKDRDAFFVSHIGAGEPDLVWRRGSLSNDGERVTIVSRDPQARWTVDVRFNDGPGWPAAADGLGKTLVLTATSLAAIAQGQAVDFSAAGTWTESPVLGGSPKALDTFMQPTGAPTPLPPGATFAPTPMPTPMPPTLAPTPLPPGHTFAPTPAFVQQPQQQDQQDPEQQSPSSSSLLSIVLAVVGSVVFCVILASLCCVLVTRQRVQRRRREQFEFFGGANGAGQATGRRTPVSNYRSRRASVNMTGAGIGRSRPSSKRNTQFLGGYASQTAPRSPPVYHHHQQQQQQQHQWPTASSSSVHQWPTASSSSVEFSRFQQSPATFSAAPAPATSTVVSGSSGAPGFTCRVCGNVYVSSEDLSIHHAKRH